MESHYTITDNGAVVVDVTITEDGKVIVTTSGTQVKPGEEVAVSGAEGGGGGAAQYVWGATNLAERAATRPSARLEVAADEAAPAELADGERRVDAGVLTPPA